ncbi:hypothetical protein BJY24_007065 [Nocardia transvalensis]|uniref:Uncharacterized protein n=1 Tax=Nocardia transvalensis TaxID=37333 RepID=A0A7W9UM28_9NOCA|nr:hypothetical protein [Nocardia transvalensis]MBB5918153.1 hypothetical protein [Nocardia transvalensis]
MGPASLETLQETLYMAWSADTSAAQDWTEQNRAKGQCAVTACVVQDYFAGDIVHTTATLPDGKTISHYLNVIDDETVDLTRQQFPQGTRFTEPAPKVKGFKSTRDYCLSDSCTVKRYEILRRRVAGRLEPL